MSMTEDQFEIESLSALRDTPLQRLTSGHARLPVAELMMDESL